MTYDDLLNMLRRLEPAELQQEICIVETDSDNELKLVQLTKQYNAVSLVPKVILNVETANTLHVDWRGR
jgi:hypothetical protein